MLPTQKDRKSTPSEKRKELRKEKSRAAARCRRSRESEVFDDMLAVLPLPAGCRDQLDKASVVRLAINYVKLREFMREMSAGDCIGGDVNSFKTFDVNSFSHFLLLLNDAGEIVYVTENIAKMLGLSQFDLFGNSVYDFVHPCDHDDVRAVLHDKESATCTLFTRMKCTLLPKGRAVHIKSASYKVVKFSGQVYRRRVSRKEAMPHLQSALASSSSQYHLLLTGELIPNPADGEVVLDESMFMTHHSMDMKITYYDGKMASHLGYEESVLVGTSLYDYVHASDAKSIEKLFKTLYSKGQISTERYRVLAGGGGYIWVVTQATIVLSKKTNAPKHVVCIHTVLSGIEQPDMVYAEVQRTGVAVSARCLLGVVPKKELLESPPTANATTVDYVDTGIMDATEALFSELNCDSEPATVTAAEQKSDIFTATVNLFKDFDEDDWLAVGDGLTGTAELFEDEDDHSSMRPMTPVDLSEGLLIDTTGLDTTGLDASLDASLDEDLDMCMRAPYIPMCPQSDEIFAGSKVPDRPRSFSVIPTAAPLSPAAIQFVDKLTGTVGHRKPVILPRPSQHSGPQPAPDHVRQRCAADSSSFVGATDDSPRPGCSAPCSPSLPSPSADSRSMSIRGAAALSGLGAGPEALQALWSQLSHLFASPTGAEEAMPSASLLAAAAVRSSVAASGSVRRIAATSSGGGGDYQWLDDVIGCLDSASATSGMQEKAPPPSLKRPVPVHVNSAAPPAKKSLLSTEDGTEMWPTPDDGCSATAGRFLRADSSCQNDAEDGKRSLLLRLLLHGHDGRDDGGDGCREARASDPGGQRVRGARGEGVGGGGWLDAQPYSRPAKGQQQWA